jgi:hypothetical protein
LAALHEELRKNYNAIVDELMSRAQVELKGTLYEQMNEQKILRMRYSNVLDVIIEYVEDNNDALFLQHHIVIFMQRYYVNIDETTPLSREMIEQRRVQIVTSVNMYLRVLKKFVSNQHHDRLDQIWVTVRKFIHQMGDYLSGNLGRLATRLPTLKMQGIEYDAGSEFDIDPEKWN